MKNPISDAIADCLIPRGELHVKVVRWDGSTEEKVVKNLVTIAGMNRYANRAVVAAATTPFGYLAIGSYTVASNQVSLASTNFGELSRKVAITAVQTKEFIYLVATYGGAAQSITSLTIDSGALCDHANSGSGIVGAIGQGLAVTLGNSDFLNLTYRVQVGSHNGSHST